MIGALLGGGEAGHAGAAAVLLRAAFHAGGLGGAGLAFFALLFGGRLDVVDAARLRAWAGWAAALGVLAGTGALAAQVGVLTGGGTLLDTEVWSAVMASRAGTSYSLAGAGLLLVALLALGRRWAVPAALGGLLVCASYTAAGHTTALAPRPPLACLLLVHVAVAAFWIGSLPPLAWTARRDGTAAARLVEGWARVAILAVPALVAAGLVLAWWIGGGARQLFASRYGWALLAKVALVGALLGFAAWHRHRLAPALTAGAPGAGRRLSRSVRAEAVVAVLVLCAAAELASIPPGGLTGRAG